MPHSVLVLTGEAACGVLPEKAQKKFAAGMI
jgi:hypothetical protein